MFRCIKSLRMARPVLVGLFLLFVNFNVHAATPTSNIGWMCGDGTQTPEEKCATYVRAAGYQPYPYWYTGIMEGVEENEGCGASNSYCNYKCYTSVSYNGEPKYNNLAASFSCYTQISTPSCDDPDYPWPFTDGNGDITSCEPDPCDGELIEGGQPSIGEQNFYANNGYLCTPAAQGSCKIYPVGPSPSGGQMYREHSEGGHCSTQEASHPDGTPTDSSTAGGDDPNSSADLGVCGTASPYDGFCFGDPSEDCPGGECRPGCGFFNADFICTNDDYVGQGDPYGTPPDSPPDGDITGDGEVNVDFGPTNALLQQIRNNTAAMAAGQGEGTQVDVSGIEDRLDTQIGILGTDEEWTGLDLEALIQQEETDRLKVTTVDGEQWVLGESEDGSIFIEKQSDFEAGLNSLFPAFGLACPNLTITNALGQDFYVDTSVWSVWIRAAMSMLLWFGVFVSGYFMFFKWALL